MRLIDIGRIFLEERGCLCCKGRVVLSNVDNYSINVVKLLCSIKRWPSGGGNVGSWLWLLFIVIKVYVSNIGTTDLVFDITLWRLSIAKSTWLQILVSIAKCYVGNLCQGLWHRPISTGSPWWQIQVVWLFLSPAASNIL